jgi:hypothetical protein
MIRRITAIIPWKRKLDTLSYLSFPTMSYLSFENKYRLITYICLLKYNIKKQAGKVYNVLKISTNSYYTTIPQ